MLEVGDAEPRLLHVLSGEVRRQADRARVSVVLDQVVEVGGRDQAARQDEANAPLDEHQAGVVTGEAQSQSDPLDREPDALQRPHEPRA